MRWLTSGPAVQSRKTRRKLVVQYGGKREELPIQVDDHEVDLADGTTMRNGIINALGSRFAHISPEQELDLILGTVPSINFEKDIGEAVFMPLLEQSALASIGNSFGKAGVLVEGQVIGEDSRGFYVDVGLKFPARILRDKLPQWEQDVVTTGSLLHVKLMDAEKTAHLQGDSSHTSIHLAMAQYVDHIGTAASVGHRASPAAEAALTADEEEDAAAAHNRTLRFSGLGDEGEGGDAEDSAVDDIFSDTDDWDEDIKEDKKPTP